MEKYNELLVLVESSKKDFEAFYNKNNHAAGTRVRRAMQDIKNMAQDIRIEITAIKQAHNTKI